MSPMRWVAITSGVVVAVCVLVLEVDYMHARSRAPKDDTLIKALQQLVKADAALAPRLAVEKKRVTDARIARKSRDNAVAWMLIVVSAVFLVSVKRALPPKPPYRPPPRPIKSRVSAG